MSFNILYYWVREVEIFVFLVVEDSNGFVSIFCYFFFYCLWGGINFVKIKFKNVMKGNRLFVYKIFYLKIVVF